jgi:hypothetical protein
MHTFTNKMRDVLDIDDKTHGDVLTPGRTDEKVNRDDEHDPNDKYRSQLRRYLELVVDGPTLRHCVHHQGAIPRL